MPLADLARKYAGPGPRYTSYPTAIDFDEGVGPATYEAALGRADARAADAPWSLYVHVPFCRRRCHFCACSVVATERRERVTEPYLESLGHEIAAVARHLPTRRRFTELHLGGGTPTYLAPAQLDRLLKAIEREFVPTPDARRSLEVDARVTTSAHLDVLAEHGFRRVSLGVQDLDPQVQSLIGREQSAERIESVIRAARARGFDGVNVDILYGLPGQSIASLLRTIAAVRAMGVDRVAIYGYAHVPWMAKNQRHIDVERLPGPSARLDMFIAARDALVDAGFVALGLDHFATPEDELSSAATRGTLRRNFMGYTVSRGDDLLAFGPTAIGDVDGVLVQNARKLIHWQRAANAGTLATERGVARAAEDRLRAEVIETLMCGLPVHRRDVQRRHRLSFDTHFADALEDLAPLVADGIAFDDGESLGTTALGRAFVRSVARCFDVRTRTRQRARFSAAI